MTKDLILRFVIGGVFVSAFAVLGDMFRPRSFAGLFGAAPSVALATLVLVISDHGSAFASIEARFMMAGAVALGIYSQVVSWWMVHHEHPSMIVTLVGMVIWFGVAFGLGHLME